MSVIEIHTKSEPQPWMAYKCGFSNSRELDCCSSLFTDNDALLPFQIISTGPFEKIEISSYGEDSWTEITMTIHEELIEGLWFISYHGDAIAPALSCGTYDVRLTAGDIWIFEPITIKNFTITSNTFTYKDNLMLPFKFGEQVFNNKPIIAPVDSYLPFMYCTENASTSPQYYIVDEDGVSTLLAITVGIMTISGKTYYIHEAECIYPFLECGNYYLKIVDGAFTYYSVWFHAESNIDDIPDGYRPVLDNDNKIILTDDCGISTIRCSNIIEYGYLYNYYVILDARNIAPTGWHVPTELEWETLYAYIDPGWTPGGGGSSLGGRLKESGYTYWNSPNTGATNIYGLNMRGSGIRRIYEATSVYEELKMRCYHWASTDIDGDVFHMYYNTSELAPSGWEEYTCGCSIRLIKDDDNNTGEMIGNDGYIYQTVKIDNQVWIASNLRETKYRNGDIISKINDADIWAALGTGALCAYNNDDNNV
jgi:uncharacterized protein (TIGR02145 family)